ncbi:hypothetical protein D915_004190 [Fasciola hepatica]|uniref:Uncharacterized protein n=1 Tax=Fasciola hepatica TaxID=6192 RepID=A0A4E0RZU6_FASHE|nr:hypothetical protein D915_004190 [Fasciola hepatica]
MAGRRKSDFVTTGVNHSKGKSDATVYSSEPMAATFSGSPSPQSKEARRGTVDLGTDQRRYSVQGVTEYQKSKCYILFLFEICTDTLLIYIYLRWLSVLRMFGLTTKFIVFLWCESFRAIDQGAHFAS